MTIKAIKINLDEMTIHEVHLNKGNLGDIYRAIGNGCRVFAVPITYENGDALYCDDEALFNNEITHGIKGKGWTYPIFGNCLIIGTTKTGDSTSAKTTLEDVPNMFQIVSRT